MDKVNLICSCIQAICWIIVFILGQLLLKERRKLRVDNRTMFQALLDICFMNNIGDMQSRASDVLDLMTENRKRDSGSRAVKDK